MAALMVANDHLLRMEPSCAICGAAAQPECPHESSQLGVALNQAMERWNELQEIRQWVLDRAKNQVILTFDTLRKARWQRHTQWLQSLPCYNVYVRYPVNPPIDIHQRRTLESQISFALQTFKQGIDDDWRKCCLKYPEILDYYFGLVDWTVPDDREACIRDPRFGGGGSGLGGRDARRPRSRRGSGDAGGGHRRRERRRSQGGRYSPPRASTPGTWR